MTIVNKKKKISIHNQWYNLPRQYIRLSRPSPAGPKNGRPPTVTLYRHRLFINVFFFLLIIYIGVR